MKIETGTTGLTNNDELYRRTMTRALAIADTEQEIGAYTLITLAGEEAIAMHGVVDEDAMWAGMQSGALLTVLVFAGVRALRWAARKVTNRA